MEAPAAHLPLILSDAVSDGSESNDGSDLKLLLFSSAHTTFSCRNRGSSAARSSQANHQKDKQRAALLKPLLSLD